MRITIRARIKYIMNGDDEMIVYRQLIRQAQRGDMEAVGEIVFCFDALIVKTALQYRKYFPDFEEAKSIGTCALVEGIYAYDLMKNQDVTLHMVKWIIKGFNREKRLLTKHTKQRDTMDHWDWAIQGDPFEALPDTAQKLPEDQLVWNETGGLLTDALKKLSATEFQIIQLRYCYQYTFAEISKRLGIPRQKVSKIHSRICQELREYLLMQKGEKTDEMAWHDMWSIGNKSPKHFS